MLAWHWKNILLEICACKLKAQGFAGYSHDDGFGWCTSFAAEVSFLRLRGPSSHFPSEVVVLTGDQNWARKQSGFAGSNVPTIPQPRVIWSTSNPIYITTFATHISWSYDLHCGSLLRASEMCMDDQRNVSEWHNVASICQASPATHRPIRTSPECDESPEQHSWDPPSLLCFYLSRGH